MSRTARSLVFIVTSELTAATFLKGYLANLRERGFTVTVVAASTGRLESLARQEGIDSHAVPMRRDPSPLADLASLRALISLLRRLRPEIVVTATPKASLLGMLAGVLTRVPVRVYQVWGLRVETELGLRRAALTSLERMTLRMATHIVANSHSLADEVHRLARGRRVEVVGHGSSHGVDIEHFNRRRADIPRLPPESGEALAADGVVVGVLGRVHRDKGILTLLEAARIVANQRPTTLLVVGPGEDEVTERALAADLAPLRLVRVGAVDDARPWFLAMDIHVLPTLREGFPNVVLEAAALGVPTVTTTATGARDSVIDGSTGVLVPPGDAHALAEAIERLASDSNERLRLADAARTRVENDFRSELVWKLQGDFLENARPGGSP